MGKMMKTKAQKKNRKPIHRRNWFPVLNADAFIELGKVRMGASYKK